MPIKIQFDEMGGIQTARVEGHGPTMFCNAQAPTCGSISFSFVPPRGAAWPVIYFVGEAPGEEEDKQAKPFVGKAGEILNQTIAAIAEGEWYRIGNTVSCRPTEGKKNRTPHEKEIRTCSWYVQSDILKARPSAIVAMGRSAMSGLFPGLDEGMGVMKDMELHWHGIPVHAVYHPAYLARKGGLGSEAWQLWADSIQEVYEGIMNRPPWD
jgi:uracil-DNA glycosylase family 4